MLLFIILITLLLERIESVWRRNILVLAGMRHEVLYGNFYVVALFSCQTHKTIIDIFSMVVHRAWCHCRRKKK